MPDAIVEISPRLEESPQADPTIETVPARMSYEEFLDWADEDTLAEWVDGEVIFMSPASLWHQTLSDFLQAIFQHHCEAHDLGVVLSAPFQMRIASRPSGREPDILFVARANLERMRETFLDGPADLVVEIVSPESRQRDRGEKYFEYETGGVREYWLLDPQRRRAEWYQLSDDGAYQFVAPVDGVYHSQVLSGLWIREEWLWQQPLPRLLDVLREWKLI